VAFNGITFRRNLMKICRPLFVMKHEYRRTDVSIPIIGSLLSHVQSGWSRVITEHFVFTKQLTVLHIMEMTVRRPKANGVFN
jgi:hypothetical protein